MLRKKTSTKLLAFIVAAVTVIPTTAFAADTAEQTKQGTDPAVLFTSEEAPAIPPAAPAADGQTGTEAQPAGEASAPAVTEPAVTDPQTPVVTEPAVTDPQTPAVTEPAVTDPQTPATTEPAVTDPETPAVPEQPEVQTPPAVVITDAGIIAEETTTEGAITSEPAIVVPEAATLTITHRLVVGEQYLDDIQTVEGLTVGQTVDLLQYMKPASWEECLSQTTSITLDGTENTAIVEYGVKADSGVIVVIDDKKDNADGEM